MANFLVLYSAATGPASISNLLAREALAALRSDGDRIVEHDLDSQPVARLSSANLAAVGRSAPEQGAAAEVRALSDALIGEVEDADLLVIAAPMYNFGIPAVLKAWFDLVIRAGVTFEYSATGPVGLLSGKRALVCSARGGIYQGARAPLDCVTPHVRAMLGVIGISDVTFVIAEGLQLSLEARDPPLAAAREQLASAVAQLQRSLG